jgi:hypothetical protein
LAQVCALKIGLLEEACAIIGNQAKKKMVRPNNRASHQKQKQKNC